mmetsp:Transcript_13222/g.30131  ORF Transcript_13222/g.30131 Transcript_13222/m.30131 type:complete len:112 (-) Transcript_13222:112-447(-)
MRLGARVGVKNKLLRGLVVFSEGTTPLHNAAARGDVLLCRHLLDSGASCKLHNSLGQTPLQCARWWLSGSLTGRAPNALEGLLMVDDDVVDETAAGSAHTDQLRCVCCGLR